MILKEFAAAGMSPSYPIFLEKTADTVDNGAQ